jgi:hypothetical protein
LSKDIKSKVFQKSHLPAYFHKKKRSHLPWTIKKKKNQTLLLERVQIVLLVDYFISKINPIQPVRRVDCGSFFSLVWIIFLCLFSIHSQVDTMFEVLFVLGRVCF